MNTSRISQTHKSALSLCMAIFLLTPHVTYANLPVIDVSSIAQSVLQFNQMIQEAVKYEKELKKLGIDTGRVGGILGQLDGVTNGILGSMEAVKNLPDGLKNMFQEINEQCDFLKESPEFKKQVDSVKKDIKDIADSIKEQTACLKVVNDAKFMTEEMARNTNEAQEALKKGDFDKYNSRMNRVRNLTKTQNYMRKSPAIEKKKSYEALYTFYTRGKGEAAELLGKDNIAKRHTILYQQARESSTQTDAQNLSNQLLSEIMTMLRMQYDMMMEFNSAMLALQSQDLDPMEKTKLKQKSDQEIKEEKAKIGVFGTDSPFEKYKGEYKKDALGLPIIGASAK